MKRKYKNSGFTLIELMIVVAILGILSAVAFTAYSAYIRRSYNAEATAMLADIRVKQESYKATFHQYADLSGDGWQPRTTFTAEAAPWPDPAPTCWRQLGIRTTGNLYFMYTGVSGLPGAAPAAEYTAMTSGTAWYAQDFWYGAKALANFDGGGCEGFVVTSGGSIAVHKASCP